MSQTIRLFMFIEAAAFLAAASSHFGLLIKPNHDSTDST